ncbi:hypothetical protein V5E97_11245 [Singulisphaera sp. Ch08]|uniref:DUF1018 domain-containing protein n=1 Tax=Singulisphaera sp. Ch08 TaxID=3120278 RepID=A0AAU7CMN1_9BACT
MAKPRRTTDQPGEVGPSSSDEEVQRAVEKIRDYYKIGKEALAAIPEGAKNDGKTIKRLATEKNLSGSEVRQARLFAARYTEDELEALLLLRIGGLPLAWDQVKDLVKVRSKVKRTALQEEAAKKSWPIRKLRTEIKARGLHRSKNETPRRAGGRRHAPASSPPIALVQILDLSNQWLRYYVDSGVGGPDSPLKELSRVSRKERQARLQQILETKSALEALGASVALVTKQLQHSTTEIEKSIRGDEKPVKTKPAAPESAKKARPQSQEAKAKPKSGPRQSTRKRPPK